MTQVRLMEDDGSDLEALLDALHGPDRPSQLPEHFGNGVLPVVDQEGDEDAHS